MASIGYIGCGSRAARTRFSKRSKSQRGGRQTPRGLRRQCADEDERKEGEEDDDQAGPQQVLELPQLDRAPVTLGSASQRDDDPGESGQRDPDFSECLEDVGFVHTFRPRTKGPRPVDDGADRFGRVHPLCRRAAIEVK